MTRLLERIIRNDAVIACSGLAWVMVACSDKVVIGAQYGEAADSSVVSDAGDPTLALESCPICPVAPRAYHPFRARSKWPCSAPN